MFAVQGRACDKQVQFQGAPVDAVQVVLAVRLLERGCGGGARARVPQQQLEVVAHAGQLGGAPRLPHQVLDCVCVALHNKAGYWGKASMEVLLNGCTR